MFLGKIQEIHIQGLYWADLRGVWLMRPGKKVRHEADILYGTWHGVDRWMCHRFKLRQRSGGARAGSAIESWQDCGLSKTGLKRKKERYWEAERR